MTGKRRLNVSAGAAAATVLSVLLVGAGGTYLLMRDRFGAGENASAAAAAPPPVAAVSPPAAIESAAPPAASTSTLPDVIITLTKEAIDRAGIGVTPVSTRSMTDHLRLPGVVEPNAYRQVSVTPLVGGRVVRVSVQLGDRVRRGQPVAQVYSPELAEARTKYVASKAMLDAHDRELQRTQKLVEIGAASRQELERIHAEHAAQTAEVESARSRLQLLGADAEGPSAATADVSAATHVPAPIDGVVTERFANVGLNVDPATKLFTIVDLSSVWIIADVFERDLQRVREGARATVSTDAIPGLSLEGRVNYIDPRLDSVTRTAKVRVEVANPRGDLRLGMYTDVAIASASGASVISVPKGAIQTVGGRQVVYLPASNQPGRFVERDVRIGRSSAEMVEVLSGLTGTDSVVASGSFFLRAEAERLGLRGRAASQPSDGQPANAASGPAGDLQSAKVVVSENGFEPAKVSVRTGVPARITFVRTTDNTCGTEVVFRSLNIKRALPLNQPVQIEFTPAGSGEIAFSCGMNMLHGTILAQ
jgi:RND family efflux transporter MFP subunit